MYGLQASLRLTLGRDPFNKNSDQSDREKWFTSTGGPVFSKLFRLNRTDPLSFGPKFPEILVEWIPPLDCANSFVYSAAVYSDVDLYKFDNIDIILNVIVRFEISNTSTYRLGRLGCQRSLASAFSWQVEQNP